MDGCCGYFTFWSLLLVAVGPEAVSRPTAVFTSAAGFYLTYIRPRRMVVETPSRGRLVIEGPALRAADLLFHQLPLLYLARRRRSQPFLASPGGMVVALLVFTAYLGACGDAVLPRYGLSPIDVLPLAGLAAAALALAAATPG